MSFRALRECTFLDVHLEPANYAEVVTYYPKTGPPRAVTVHAEMDREYQTIETVTGQEMETLTVACSRNPQATASNGQLRGGIEAPKVGDRITRAPSRDDWGEPYTFTGQVREPSHYKWRLVFQRRSRPDQGMPN